MSSPSSFGAGLARLSLVGLSVLALGGMLVAYASSSAATTSGAHVASGAYASCSGVSGTHHARVVVEVSPAKIISSCVGFSTRKISAVKLLDASHIAFGTESYSGLGLAICAADNVPAHYSKCFSSSGPYWALFISRNGAAWKMPSVGVSHITVHPGDSIGFRYDSQTGTARKPPAPRPA
jgi:hypothetical protein